jgi:hypothetical protein
LSCKIFISFHTLHRALFSRINHRLNFICDAITNLVVMSPRSLLFVLNNKSLDKFSNVFALMWWHLACSRARWREFCGDAYNWVRNVLIIVKMSKYMWKRFFSFCDTHKVLDFINFFLHLFIFSSRQLWAVSRATNRLVVTENEN